MLEYMFMYNEKFAYYYMLTKKQGKEAIERKQSINS